MAADAVRAVHLGTRDYLACWDFQRLLAARRREGEIPDLLLLVEHPPTYTIGRGGHRSHLLVDEATLARLGARCYAVDRGGDITFHGPGQLVAYVILDLGRAERSVRRFVERLERTVIEALGHFGVRGGIDPGRPGVWVGRDKIAAIGIAVRRGVTYHGFALNIDVGLDYFGYMIPCGIPDRGVTSLARLLGHPVSMEEAGRAVVASFARAFERPVIEASDDQAWLHAVLRAVAWEDADSVGRRYGQNSDQERLLDDVTSHERIGCL
jgi:lipoate-protein ligase B